MNTPETGETPKYTTVSDELCNIGDNLSALNNELLILEDNLGCICIPETPKDPKEVVPEKDYQATMPGTLRTLAKRVKEYTDKIEDINARLLL